MPDTIHLRPTAPLADRVLLPGDPGRALRLAQALLEEPRMFNHNRGLWGYTGTAPDGEPLTVQSTGMGGPSAAIVVAELADLGASRLLRVGTCGALESSLALGELAAVSVALGEDGTSTALRAADPRPADPGDPLEPSPRMLRALVDASGGQLRLITVLTTDLFYDGDPGDEQRWLAAGASAVEMETAALFALARRRSLAAASLLIVSDLVLPRRRRIAEERLHEAELELGRLALASLTGPGRG